MHGCMCILCGEYACIQTGVLTTMHVQVCTLNRCCDISYTFAYVCVYTHTHTHCTYGVLGCEPRGLDETPGDPEEWTKSRLICIRLCIQVAYKQSSHVYAYGRTRNEILDLLLFPFTHFFFRKRKTKDVNAKPLIISTLNGKGQVFYPYSELSPRSACRGGIYLALKIRFIVPPVTQKQNPISGSLQVLTFALSRCFCHEDKSKY